MTQVSVAVVVPVFGNAGTIEPLAQRLARALDGLDWRLRLVIDASPDTSAGVAYALSARDTRVAVTELAVNRGQHRALVHGLAAEPDAESWILMDADLQDPPEAVPRLLARLAAGDADVVFAGRRGPYEGPVRRLTGTVHRAVAAALTGLPRDAGGFLVMGARARRTCLAAARDGAPSVVVALGATGLDAVSIPVVRDARPVGTSAWTSGARARQSARSLYWAATRLR